MSKKDSLDLIFKNHVDVFNQQTITFGRGECITVWMPEGYKKRYDHLQEVTRRKFSKLVREVIKSAIDRAEKSDSLQSTQNP